MTKPKRECGCPIGTDYLIVKRDNRNLRAEAGEDAITVCAKCGAVIEL